MFSKRPEQDYNNEVLSTPHRTDSKPLMNQVPAIPILN